MNSNRPIFLIGFMASGKTTLAQKVAEQTFYYFIDTDEEIMKNTGLSVSEIITTKSESYFRHIETQWLDAFNFNFPCIVSCGGGMPCFNDNLYKMKSIGKVVFVNTDFDTILEHLEKDRDNKRPLYSKENLRNLYENRLKYYYLADMEISIDENDLTWLDNM